MHAFRARGAFAPEFLSVPSPAAARPRGAPDFRLAAVRPWRKGARLSALHLRLLPTALAVAQLRAGFPRAGHWRPSRPAGSLQSGPNAARPESRSRPSTGLRAPPAGAALAPPFRTS